MNDITFPPISSNYTIRQLNTADLAKLQELCEKCTDYFELAEGNPAGENAAHHILTGLPEGKQNSDKFALGVFFNNTENLIGVIDIVQNFPISGEWILGLLLIDPIYRNRGTGQEVYRALSEWCRKNAAISMRIGVLKDNDHALRFWQRLGFVEVERKNKKFGSKMHTVIFMRNKV
jgi:GNAT superfamily N-acetyltransferase